MRRCRPQVGDSNSGIGTIGNPVVGLANVSPGVFWQSRRTVICRQILLAVRDGPLAQGADYAKIGDMAERLAFAHSWLPKMFNGYAIVREGETIRVLYPAIQAHLDAVRGCLGHAAGSPSGRFLEAQSADGLHGVILQECYPAFYVYQVQERFHASGSWKPGDRAGHDQLVALLAKAYHKGHWFVRGDTPAEWIPM